MTRNNGPKTDHRNPDGTFAAGNLGRPKGARHKTTLAVEALLEGQSEALTQKAVDLALAGDTVALRLCLERIAPPRKDVPVSLDLPEIETAQDAANASRAVLNAMAEGAITPLEAAQAMAVIEQFRRTLETTELEQRITALETQK